MRALDDQQEYYRQRAPEYDEWWQAKGQYAKTPAERERWFADVHQIEIAFERFGPAALGWQLTAEITANRRIITASGGEVNFAGE